MDFYDNKQLFLQKLDKIECEIMKDGRIIFYEDVPVVDMSTGKTVDIQSNIVVVDPYFALTQQTNILWNCLEEENNEKQLEKAKCWVMVEEYLVLRNKNDYQSPLNVEEIC